MEAYPAASSSEINSIISTKWKALKKARREQAGNLGNETMPPRKKNITSPPIGSGRLSSKAETEEPKEVPRPRRKAAKNVAANAYLDEENEEHSYADSPVTTEEEIGIEEGGGGVEEESGGRKRKRGAGAEDRLKVPRIKIKMIGRSQNNDSPIFCAQPLEEVINVCGWGWIY